MIGSKQRGRSGWCLGMALAILLAFAYDDQTLYVFVAALDRRPAAIKGLLTRRDTDSPSDWVELILDPQNDRRTAYRFAVNARGVKLDARISASGETEELNWDGVWDVRTQRSAAGWTAEFAIPFSQLRYDHSSTEWGVQVQRRLLRNNELSVLNATPRATARPLLYLARLAGLHGLPPPRRLDLIPYLVAGHEWEAHDSRYLARAGADLRLGLGSATTLQLSLLPDFGQVESDPSQLNLSAFELFLPERRQLFLDGQELFAFKLDPDQYNNETLYYSRRIGAQPQRQIELGDDERFLREPRRTSILGAGKLIGRSSDGFSYAALSVLSDAEQARITTPQGDRSEPVAPIASYSVLRLRKELTPGGSVLGAMATHVERLDQRTLADTGPQRATTAAFDSDFRVGELSVLTQVIGSHVAGSRVAIDELQRSTVHVLQRPDAHHLNYDRNATSLSGYGGRITAGKVTGTPWRGIWGVQVRSPGLELNDLGYQLTADSQSAFAWLQRRFDTANSVIRRAEVDVKGWFGKTFGPEITGLGGLLNGYVHFAGNWGAWLGGLREIGALDTRLLRGGPAFRMTPKWAGWFGVHGDTRGNWDATVDGGFDLRDEDSLSRFRLAVTGNFRPTSAVNLALIPSFEHTVDDLQYVDTLETAAKTRYLLGRLRRHTGSLTVRASWALALGLTLELYASPFLSVGRYERFYEATEVRAEHYADRRQETPHTGDDRFNFAQLRSNLVLRWDYDPGGTLFAVWSHEQSAETNCRGCDAGQPQFPRDAGVLLGARPTDVVMLKLSHAFLL